MVGFPLSLFKSSGCVMTSILVLNSLVILSCVTALWLLSIYLKDVSIIDYFWGFGFVVIAWVTLSQAKPVHSTQYLLPVLVSVWGLRLVTYLGIRNWGEEEDKRYAEMRVKRGVSFWWKSFFIVFLLQGIVMWIVSLPLQYGVQLYNPINFLHILGISLWGVGLYFEAVGDAQLMSFKARPENQGKVLDSGLWRYTRHPNYFGDFAVWWGLYLVAIGNGAPLWVIIGPLLMSFFLTRISGVKMTEDSMTKSKPQYRDYIQKTNAFIPGPPKKT